jgi:ankyrin repeat protein
MHVDQDGVGVLHIAAMHGHREVIAYFLFNHMLGKSAWDCDANGHTPMFYARMKGHEDIVELLITGNRTNCADKWTK